MNKIMKTKKNGFFFKKIKKNPKYEKNIKIG